MAHIRTKRYPPVLFAKEFPGAGFKIELGFSCKYGCCASRQVHSLYNTHGIPTVGLHTNVTMSWGVNTEQRPKFVEKTTLDKTLRELTRLQIDVNRFHQIWGDRRTLSPQERHWLSSSHDT